MALTPAGEVPIANAFTESDSVIAEVGGNTRRITPLAFAEVVAAQVATVAPFDTITAETAADALATAADATQTALDRVATGADVSAAASILTSTESARDAAFVNADVYPDIATGRAAVADGEQFQVVSGAEIIRYRRDSVSTETEVARFPAVPAFDTIRTQIAINSSLGGNASTGEYDNLYNLAPSINANATGSYGGRWIAFDVGVQIGVSDVIDAIAAEIITAPTATKVRVRVWECATTDAGVNLPPAQAGDKLVASNDVANADAIALDDGADGLIAGANGREYAFPLGTSILARVGKTYKVTVEAFNASNVEVESNIASVVTTAFAQQRYVGGRKATPGAAYTNMSLTQRHSIGLLSREVFSAVGFDDRISDAEFADEAGAQEDMADRHNRNHDRLAAHSAAFSKVLPDALTFSGDSLVENSVAHVVSGQKGTDVVSRYVTGTVNNIAVGGTRSDEILAAFQALTASQQNDVGITNGGTNDVLQSVPNVVSTVVSNMESVAAISANRIIQGPWAGGNIRYYAQCSAISANLKASLGAKFFDALPFIQGYGAGSATEINVTQNGGMPTSLVADTLGHPNTAGAAIFGREWALMTRAQSGIAAPYLHDDYVVGTDTAAAAIHTVRALGPVLSYRINSGNESRAFDINATTGAITRSSVGTMPDFAELVIQAESIYGPSNEALVTVGKAMSGTTPSVSTRITASASGVVGSSARLITPALIGGSASKKFTMVIAGRMNNRANGTLLSTLKSTDFSDNVLVSKEDRLLRLLARTSDGTNIGNAFTNAAPGDPYEYHVWFFSMDTTTGVQTLKASVDELTPNTATPTADALMDLSETVQIFNAQSSILKDFDVKMLWIAQDYVDTADSAKRALFYDPATREPLDLGASGVVGGITPLIYLTGTPAEYQAGVNKGTGGRFYAPPFVNRSRVGFKSV